MIAFFFPLASNCSQQKGPTNKALPVFFAENCLNKTKGRGAKAGQQSWGMSQRGCGARAARERVWRKGTVILVLRLWKQPWESLLVPGPCQSVGWRHQGPGQPKPLPVAFPQPQL